MSFQRWGGLRFRWRRLRAALLIWLVASLAQGCASDGFDREVDQFAEWLRVEPGAVVADIGAGEGEYAIALAARVGPEGRVYATEIEEEKRVEILEAAREAGVDRVEVREAQIEGTGLAPACCDAIFLRTVYHHLTDPEPFTRSLYETLRPGGRLAIVDFRPTALLALWTPDGIPEDRGGHGIEPALVVRELEAVGFVQVDSLDPWPSGRWFDFEYGLLFEKPRQAAHAGEAP